MKTMFLFYLTIFVFLCTGNFSVFSQEELPRRVYLGIRMENLTEDVKTLIGISDQSGVLITEVFPGSTAQKSGFRRGDILTTIDGTSVESITALLEILRTKKSGEKFSFSLIRDKKSVTGKSSFQPFPAEVYPDLKVEYLTSTSEIGMQRIILTGEKSTSKKPLLVFIGGIGCYSLDSPMDTNTTEIQLLNQLTRSGYRCARIEKPGMGDNAGYCKSCQEVSFMEELSGYINAVQTLKKRSDIDSSQVFVFGHSMGGVFAPLISQQTHLAGIIAYGTIGSNFVEYLAKTRRTIAEAYSFSPTETDDLVKNFCACAHYYFAEQMTTSEASSRNEICSEYLSIFDLRSRAYNNELYALNIPELWRNYTGKALLIWGESDYISSREDHEIVSNTVNYYHPGNGSFKTVPQADHGMAMAESFQAATSRSGIYNRNVGNEILLWLGSIY